MHPHGIAGHLDLLGFVTLGLLGSVGHCVGMCSPFVLMVSRNYADARRSAAVAQLWYAAGRITTYSLLGAAAGILGSAIEFGGRLMGVQRTAAIAAGVALIITALLTLTERSATARPVHGGWFEHMLTRVRIKFPGHPLVLGLFLGLLPCGLLYTAVVAAIARGGALDGAVALAAFGVGTVPALIGVAVANHLFLSRPLLNRVGQVFVLIMGAWFVWRGFAA